MPEVRVQVLYDFEYTTKEGREVWMREGERLHLIKKTNQDWWQVLRNSERRPFYVPSAYVEEVHPRKTKNSFRSNRLDEVGVEPKTTDTTNAPVRPYVNGRGRKLETDGGAKQLPRPSPRDLEASKQRRRRGLDYENGPFPLSRRGRVGDEDETIDNGDDEGIKTFREKRSASANLGGEQNPSPRFLGRPFSAEGEDTRRVSRAEEAEERSASLDHRRRRPATGRTAVGVDAVGRKARADEKKKDSAEEVEDGLLLRPRRLDGGIAMGNKQSASLDNGGDFSKVGRSSGRKSSKSSQEKQKKEDGLLPVPLAFQNLVYEADEELVDNADEVQEDEGLSTQAEETSGRDDEVAAHSTSTLMTPSSSSSSPASAANTTNTTTLPRLLRPPSSPLRARSSPSTPTLPTASAHHHHHHHHHRPITPPPSIPVPCPSVPPPPDAASSSSSASSSPTYVSAAPFPEAPTIALPPPSRPVSSSSLLPPPSPTQEQQAVRQLSNGWAEYSDASGRTFFHNGDTGEKSWKPPRRRTRKDETTDGSRSCSSSPLAETDDTTSRGIPMPSGWRESYDSSMEQACYVNLVTGAKWYSSNDMEGRVYFFEENSNESSWTLPETPPPGAGVSGSPAGSDSFISGRSSGGEEAGSRETTEREGSGSGALVGVSRDDMVAVMPLVKMKMNQWEKGGKLIQLRDSMMDKELRAGRSTRAAKTRSMVIGDPGVGDVKILGERGKGSKDWPQLWDGNMYIIREGTLNKTKITENKKRVRKNWAPSHVVLTELLLLFFKDAKTFAAVKAGTMGGSISPGDAGAMPELSVDLNGALVDREDQLSSRRNVFRVSTVLGLQVLCQDDNAQNAEAWFQDISKAALKLPSGFDGSPRMNTLELRNYAEPHSPDEHKKFPRIGRSKSVKVKKDASMEDLSAANITERQVKIKARLKKFFHRRPTMESLVKKGIWKDEPAFGCYLEQVSGEGIPRIPLFVQRCIAAIESKPENMKADGLYRASGNLSQVQKIRLQVDQNNLSIVDMEEDVHVLTGALKLFFRELKEPLIPYSLFNRALTASTNANRKEQLHEFKDIVKILPVANYDTLKFLLQHLLRVTSFQEFNRMHIANLAIVFGPTLMWPKQESLNMALDLMQQNLVIECLLQEFDTIFSSGR
ncbi:rho GTPase-activating protein 12-like isoform X2 [Hetaerina americana]|uniref:rho GTPase-activating protein 12-like isoform X2 n=1 Tax=Hetaerina americana TaxID=62018 RepID=UPI003A7F3745